jgi:hypothetical protein
MFRGTPLQSIRAAMFTPKGWERSAQGNALGRTEDTEFFTPKG